jgi:DNA mismatch repair protein MutL
MGPASIAVHAFPSFLLERGVEVLPFVRELLTRAQRGELGADIESALHETLDMMACKAAIKAGDRLAPDELSELLQSRERIERSSNCPHGRPTTLRLTIAELDKQFGRT